MRVIIIIMTLSWRGAPVSTGQLIFTFIIIIIIIIILLLPLLFDNCYHPVR
jgi:hypothetical protein